MSAAFNFLRRAAPAAATIFGSPLAGAAVGAGMEYWGSRRSARDAERTGQQAGQTAMGGFNYLQGSPIGQQYLPAGGAAIDQQSALLGLGGDTEGAQAAYQNYLNSVGFQDQLRTGGEAITGSAAARGLLGSGSTARELTRFGHQLGQQNFNNYLGQLTGVAGMGMQAGGMMGQAAQAGASQGAAYQFGGGMEAGRARREGFNALASGAGDIFREWQRGRGGVGPGGTPTIAPMQIPNDVRRGYG